MIIKKLNVYCLEFTFSKPLIFSAYCLFINPASFSDFTSSLISCSFNLYQKKAKLTNGSPKSVIKYCFVFSCKVIGTWPLLGNCIPLPLYLYLIYINMQHFKFQILILPSWSHVKICKVLIFLWLSGKNRNMWNFLLKTCLFSCVKMIFI